MEALEDVEMKQFLARFGRLSWESALARDAGTLARLALLGLPTDSVNVVRATSERRVRVRDLLAGARASLWTTENVSWAPDQAKCSERSRRSKWNRAGRQARTQPRERVP